MPRKCSAIGRIDWSFRRASPPCRSSSAARRRRRHDYLQTPATGKLHSFIALKPIVPGVQADRDTVQARGREQPHLAAGGDPSVVSAISVTGSSRPASRSAAPGRGAAAARRRSGAACAPPGPRHPPQRVDSSKVGRSCGQERELTRRTSPGHAVGAAELAAVSDRDPQVPQRPPERVSRRQVPGGHHSTPERKIPARGTARQQPGHQARASQCRPARAGLLASGHAAAGTPGLQPGDPRAQVTRRRGGSPARTAAPTAAALAAPPLQAAGGTAPGPRSTRRTQAASAGPRERVRLKVTGSEGIHRVAAPVSIPPGQGPGPAKQPSGTCSFRRTVAAPRAPR